MKPLIEFLTEGNNRNELTKSQESTFCDIFNRYYKSKSILEKEDLKYILDLKLSWYNKKWEKSFCNQYNTLYKWIESEGLKGKNLILVRPENDDDVNGIGNKINQIYRKYQINRKNKNSWDPSDAYLYDIDKKDEICKKLDDVINTEFENDLEALRGKAVAAIKGLWNTNCAFGISLKCGEEFDPIELNTNKPTPRFIENMKITEICWADPKTKKNLYLKFSYNDSNGKTHNEYYRIGAQKTGGDVEAELTYCDENGKKVGSQAGKISKEFKYSKGLFNKFSEGSFNFLKNNKLYKWDKDSQESIKKFIDTELEKDYRDIENNGLRKQIYKIVLTIINGSPETLEEFIYSSIKVGPNCVPYLLIKPIK